MTRLTVLRPVPKATLIGALAGLGFLTSADAAETVGTPDLDALRGEVVDIFKAHSCPVCHDKATAASNKKKTQKYDFVLDLKQLENSKYIVKGNPDESQLFKLVTPAAKGKTPDMPKIDFDYGTFDAEPLSDGEVATLRNWIAALDTGASTPIVSDQDVLLRIAGDLSAHSCSDTPTRCYSYRYLTLTNLKNSGDTPQQMDDYRRGMVKLVNSVSRGGRLISLDSMAVDKDRTIFRINLDELDWKPGVWDNIAKHSPYSYVPTNLAAGGLFSIIQTTTQSQVPVLRADWFVNVVSKPPLYYETLGLPDTLEKLEKDVLGVDRFDNLRRARTGVIRDGYPEGKSGVSQHNRLVEMHPTSVSQGGFYWLSYDFAASAGVRDITKLPLGPGNLFGVEGFQHDGGEAIFMLKNGMHGYYLAKATGEQLAKGPTNIVRDPDGGADHSPEVVNGISCMNCHAAGMIQNHKGSIRKDFNFSAFDIKTQGLVKLLFPPTATVDAVLKSQATRYLKNLVAIGALDAVPADLQLNAKAIRDPVNVLVDRFEKPLDKRTAAAELGLSVDEFEAKVKFAEENSAERGDIVQVVSQIRRGNLGREAFVDDFRALIASLGIGDPEIVERIIAPVTKPLPPVVSVNTVDCAAPTVYEKAKASGASALRSYVDACSSGQFAGAANDALNAVQKTAKCTSADTYAQAKQRGADGLQQFITDCAAYVPASQVATAMRDYTAAQAAATVISSRTPAQITTSDGGYSDAIACINRSDICTGGANACLAGYSGSRRSELRAYIGTRQGQCVRLPNGSYQGVRGYTDPYRPQPSTSCKNRYAFTADIEDGTISFTSDDRYWEGEVDQVTGSIHIDRNGISPAPNQATLVEGDFANARFWNGFCGSGFFRLFR